MRPRAVHFNGQPSHIKKNDHIKYTLHFTEIIINIAKVKVRLVKSIDGLHCELLFIAPFLFFKFLYKPKFIKKLFEKVTFKILNEYDRQKTSQLRTPV